MDRNFWLILQLFHPTGLQIELGSSWIQEKLKGKGIQHTLVMEVL
jgi:hypothetical protein